MFLRRLRSELTGCCFCGWDFVFGEADLVDCYHASLGRAFDLSELLDYLAVGRVMEEHDPHVCSGSGILINRIDGHGDLVRPKQPYDITSQDNGSHVYGTPLGGQHQATM